MKLYETEYKIYNKNCFKICIISDIHISDKLNSNRLDKLIEYMEDEKPDYILIPGDLLDKNSELETELSRVINFLTKLGNIGKTFIILGNHDLFDINKKYFKPIKYIEKVNKIKNVRILDNELYEDKNIFLYGLTLDFDNYRLNDKSILFNQIKDIPNKSSKLKIIMMHSPSNIDKEIIDILKYDYIICGHMHNGCVPLFIRKIWKSKRGFITPNKKLFGDNSRDTLNTKEDKLLVCSPVTTFDKISGIFRLFNFIYPMYVTKLDFNKNNTFQIHNQYKLTKKDK